MTENPQYEIVKLNHGECWTWDLGEESGAEIWKINDAYILFEIPMYGGEPRFIDVYPFQRIDDLINMVESWT